MRVHRGTRCVYKAGKFWGRLGSPRRCGQNLILHALCAKSVIATDAELSISYLCECIVYCRVCTGVQMYVMCSVRNWNCVHAISRLEVSHLTLAVLFSTDWCLNKIRISAEHEFIIKHHWNSMQPYWQCVHNSQILWMTFIYHEMLFTVTKNTQSYSLLWAVHF